MNSVLILIDRKMPAAAKEKLSGYGKVIEFAAEGLAYEAVSGHPDIFFFHSGGRLICAPNLPEEYFRIFDQHGIKYIKGRKPVGNKYPMSALYNGVLTENWFIHNTAVSDESVLMNTRDRETVNVAQGYTRCNLLPLKENSFITSDRGIEKTLKKRGASVLFISPEDVLLPGFAHGFFCGACGIYQDTVFMTGSLAHKKDAAALRNFVSENGCSLIELYDGPVFDCGSILFIAASL